MKLFVFLILATSMIISSSSEQLPDKTTCFDAINRLSLHDKILGAHSTVKQALAPEISSAKDFVDTMLKKKASGTDFKCGETMSWVSEIFEGLESQYDEYKNGKHGEKSGYHLLIGQDLIDFFLEKKSSKQRIIYHCQHTGTADHVFTIEQIPPSTNTSCSQGPTYRIYQSYNGAYSLRAWLSDPSPAIIENQDIILPHLTRCANDRKDTDPQCSILRPLWDALVKIHGDKGGVYQEFLEFNENYNVSKAAEYLYESSAMYGRGQQLNESEFFNNYLRKTATVTEFYSEFSSTPIAHSKIPNEYWIDLYASPEPTRYPGLPSNIVSGFKDPNATYRFEVKAVNLPIDGIDLNAECTKNANIILNTIPDKE